MRLTLQRKISLILLAALAFSSLGVLWTVRATLTSTLKRQRRERGLALARECALHSVDPILRNERLTLQFYVDNILASNKADVAYAFILDDTGRVLANTFEDGFPSRLRTIQPLAPGPGGSIRTLDTGKGLVDDVAVAISVDGRPLGSARIALRDEPVSEIINKALRAILLVASLDLLLALGLGLMLARMVLKPIRDLKTAAKSLGLGDLSARVPVRSPDELGQLAGVFNHMAKSLSETLISRDALKTEVEERRKLQASLAESERRFRSVLESAPVLALILDADGRVTFANECFAKALGRPPREIQGRFFFQEFLPPHPPALEENFRQAFKDLSPIPSFEGEILASSGQRLISWNASLLDNGPKIPAEMILLGTDVTERDFLNRRFTMMQKMESMGVLAGGIAHDFNNILNIIAGNISLLKSVLGASSPASAGELIDEALSASGEAKRLAQQLLTFSRGGAPIRRVLAPAPIILEAGKLALRGSPARLETSLPDDLLNLEADAGQLFQLFHNLILNAAQASPAGGVIRVAAENISLDSGPHIRFVVRDQGSGIPNENLSKIFDPYFTTKKRGKGLGLAICHSIVKSHGGQIEARSLPEGGARFSVTLAATAASPDPKLKDGRPHPRGWGRILIMDDETAVSHTLGHMLENLGYEATLVQEGGEMLSAYRKARASGTPFRAVILDLVVPSGMGGMDAAAQLKKEDPDALAIVSSGYSNDPVMSDYKKHGFSAVLTKPYQIDELASVLELLLPPKSSGPD